MPHQRERRASERVPCKLVCPFELMTLIDPSTVNLTQGFGHAINWSVTGMLVLLPEPVRKQQVVEILVSSKAEQPQRTKLAEVCWTRLIPVRARVSLCLAGTRFLFDLSAPGQSSQDH
jgi:hypothetical protein